MSGMAVVMVMKGDEMFSQAAAVRNTGTVAVCLKGYTGNQDTALN